MLDHLWCFYLKELSLDLDLDNTLLQSTMTITQRRGDVNKAGVQFDVKESRKVQLEC